MKTITVNDLSALQAMKFWLLREKYRHNQDIARIDQDLDKLREIDVPDLPLDAWYEIAYPNKATVPEMGTNVPKRGSYPKGE